MPLAFEGEEAEVREALRTYFREPVTAWSEGLIADLHRVAELGSSDGLQLILDEARRRNVVLNPNGDTDAPTGPAERRDAKHVALHTYLHNPRVFEAAADFQALRTPTAMGEFRGPVRDVHVDLTPGSIDAFKRAIEQLLEQDLQGGYCRIGTYEDDGDVNVVISHGAPMKTAPIVSGDREEIVTLRMVKCIVLRFNPVEALLRIGGVSKPRQGDVADLFAKHILARPAFFSGKDAQRLYTLDPVAKEGADFTFRHGHDERIREVRIVSASADLFRRDPQDQTLHLARSLVSKDASGGALRHFRETAVGFDDGWALSEITLRVFFHTETNRPAQVTVRLKTPGTLAFRRTRFEKAIHTLIARNGLEIEHDARLLVDDVE